MKVLRPGLGRRLTRTTVYGIFGGGILCAWDQNFNRGVISRTFSCLYNISYIGIDYKLNFREGADIDALHERSAQRLYNLITRNKGLYIKLGQSLAVQANLLPPAYGQRLSQLFDRAPQDSWEQCRDTIVKELGREPEDVFAWLDTNAIASASIAQVHHAQLKNGDDVAVKIRHADIPDLTWWDLETYKAMMWVYDRWLFHIPVYFVAKYVASQCESEIDFRNELVNTEKMRALVSGDRTLREMYVPKVYPELSSEALLVMEWIDGISLSNPEQLKSSKLDIKRALTLIFRALSKMTFEWGVVHCDPHPGNWILRRDPINKSRSQIVMLDHGTYIYMSPSLVREYSDLWRAMFRQDIETVSRITKTWGFDDPEIFASATMLQSYGKVGKNEKFVSREKAAERLRNFIKDTERVPLALVFIGRAQRILQGVNRMYGSPVNRIRIIVEGATSVSPSSHGIVRNLIARLWRTTLLLASEILFFLLQLRQRFTGENLEDMFDNSIREQAGETLNGGGSN